MNIKEKTESKLKWLDVSYSPEKVAACTAEHAHKEENIKAVPEYFNAPLNRAVSILEQEKAKDPDADIFVFTTDVHIHENPMFSVPLIKELGKHSPVGKVFCGGDLPWAFGTKEECLAESLITLELLNEIKKDLPFYYIRGNHDFTIRAARGVEEGYTLSYDKTCKLIMSYQSGDLVAPENAMYFYVDDKDKKIRYIITDNCSAAHADESTPWGIYYGFDERQARWLAEEALQIEDSEGWSVIIFGHIPCVKDMASYSDKLDPLADIIKAFANKRCLGEWDFSNTKAEFVAYICGHNHKDDHSVEDGTLFISTGSSSALWDDCWDRSKNTVNEELFDIFVLSRASKALKAIRIGAGKDREFKYNITAK